MLILQMIHAENGDMIQWLTRKKKKRLRPNVDQNEANRDIGKLEEKGMVGMCSWKKEFYTLTFAC